MIRSLLLTSAPATVTITVSAVVNQAPVAVDDDATVVRRKKFDAVPTATFSLTDNDTDSDGTINVGSVVIMEQGSAGGIVVVNPLLDGTVFYTPKINFKGTETFTYVVNDNDGETSNEATVIINVVK